jgi:hypothetical protein
VAVPRLYVEILVFLLTASRNCQCCLVFLRTLYVGILVIPLTRADDGDVGDHGDSGDLTSR